MCPAQSKIYQTINIFRIIFLSLHRPFNPWYLPKHAPLILQGAGSLRAGCWCPKTPKFTLLGLLSSKMVLRLLHSCLLVTSYDYIWSSILIHLIVYIDRWYRRVMICQEGDHIAKRNKLAYPKLSTFATSIDADYYSAVFHWICWQLGRCTVIATSRLFDLPVTYMVEVRQKGKIWNFHKSCIHTY